MSYNAGNAHVRVVPSFKGFQIAAGATIRRSMRGVGESAGTTLGSAIREKFRSTAPSIARTVGDSIKAGFASSGGALKSAGSALAGKALGGVKEKLAEGKFQGQFFVAQIQEGISSRTSAITKAAQNLGRKTVERLSTRLRGAGGAVSQAMGSVMMALGRTPVGVAGGVASRFVSRLASGILSGAGAVTGVVSSIFSPVVSTVVTPALGAARGFLSTVSGVLRAGVGGVTSAVSSMFGGATAAAKTAGTAAGTGFATSLKAMLGPLAAIFSATAIFGGGFNRLANIDDARKKMEGLQYTAEEIDSVMQSANEAVTDTAFGLDAAATAATGALGAGVDPGDELTGYLSLIGDMTTQSNTDFASMANIVNKVEGAGKLTGETLNQMTENGLQAAPMLARGFGVTIEELRKMVSEGEVSAEDFRRIMEEQIGGSALASGETVRGAFANVRAALSRTGAALMGGEGNFSAIPGMLTKVKDAINGVNDQINRAWEWARKNGDWLGPTVKGAATAIGIFKGLQIGSALLNGALRLLAANPFILMLAALGGAIGYAYTQFEGFRNLVDGFVSVLKGAGSILFQGEFTGGMFGMDEDHPFVNFLFNVREGVISFAGTLRDRWNDTILPALSAFWTFIKDTLIPGVVGFWRDVIVPAWDGISSIIADTWQNIIQPALERLWAFLRDTLIPVVVSFWQDVIVPAWGAISSIIQSAWNNVIQPALSAMWGFINDTLAPGFFWLWDHVIGPVFGWIGDRVTDIWDRVVKPVFEAMKSFAEGDLVSGFQSLWDAVKNIFGWIGNTIASAFAAPVNWILDVVWNNGIAGTFNGVMEALGLDWRLGLATLIGPPPAASTAGPGRGSSGGMTAVSAYAEGGFANRGWALVGEEGPELVNFTNPGRVYTAAETAAALAAGEDLSPSLARAAAGRTPAEALAPMGGNIFTDLWDAGVSWVRGRLADGAGVVLNPLKDLITSTIGQLGFPGALIGGSASKTIDGFLDWIRGQEAEQAEAEGVGGMLAAPIGSAPGSWVRPSRGAITSRFGPRWGGIHAGIDIGGGGPTYAAAAGTVLNTGWNIGPGRTGIGILLGHGGNMFTYYGHNPVGGVRVAKGQEVARGQHIGAQGATGRVTGVHLHFELHKGGPWKAVNPLQLGVFDDGGMLPPGGLAVNLSRRPEPVFSADQWDMISAGGVPGTSNGTTVHAPITALGADPQAVAAEVMWHVRGYGRQHVGSGR